MLQIKNLNLTHKKDLRVILSEFNLVLNKGDKAVIIGEEGNGKSTLMKWIYNPLLIDNYIEAEGERLVGKEILGYLPQEISEEDKEKTIYEFFSAEEMFWNRTPKELSEIAGKFGMTSEFFYSDQKMGSLSGGEKVKAHLMRLIIQDVTVLLLDEPSNDIDINTLEILEKIINDWEHIVLFISHDETLIENTANMVIHIEQIVRKTKTRYTVAKIPYRKYLEERFHKFESQERQALNDRKEKKIRDEKYRKIMQSVQNALGNCSRQSPAEAKNLKDKMHAVKSMERRFEKEDENMTEMPEQEEAIFFKLGDKDSSIPAGKTVIEYTLAKLTTRDEKRILAEDINLKIRGSEKICIIGANGVGKTTLLRKIAEELSQRDDIKAEYMPQNYEEILDLDMTPVDFLDKSGDKEERTRIRTYLGSLKYTADEMEHPIRELSGGQKAKVLLLSMSLSGANVLILDEPTSGLDPLMQKEFFDVLQDRNKKGTTIFLSSHVLPEIQEYCNRAAIIKEGRIIAQGPVEELAKSNAKRVTIYGIKEMPQISETIDIKEVDHGFSFLYKGKIKELLPILNKMDIKDLTITEPSLEEIFMHFYQ